MKKFEVSVKIYQRKKERLSREKEELEEKITSLNKDYDREKKRTRKA